MSIKEKKASRLYSKGMKLLLKHGKKEPDYLKAIKCLEAASNLGDCNAAYTLSTLYEQGRGVKQDNVKAIKYKEKAAQLGHKKSIMDMAFMCYYGKGVKKNLKLAAHYWQQGVDKNIFVAYYNLGCCYLKGVGVKQDPNKAMNLFFIARKWPDYDFAIAKYAYAFCAYYFTDNYYCGEAKNIFKDAYEKGITPAGIEYALCCLKSNIEADNAIGFKIIKKMADEGNAGAMWILGLLYYWGTGVKQDKEKGIKYFKLSAKKGNLDGCRHLAEIYYTVFPKSLSEKEVINYLKFASDKGDEAAKDWLQTIKKDGQIFFKSGLPTIKNLKFKVDIKYWTNILAQCFEPIEMPSHLDDPCYSFSW